MGWFYWCEREVVGAVRMCECRRTQVECVVDGRKRAWKTRREVVWYCLASAAMYLPRPRMRLPSLSEEVTTLARERWT